MLWPVSCSLGTKGDKEHATGTALASVGQEVICEVDLPPAAQGQLQELRQKEYQIKRQAVDLVVERRLLESEAKRRGLTPDELLQLEPDRNRLLEGLRKHVSVSLLLSVPRVPVTYDVGRIRGAANAPVTIIEFADFNCPFCRQMEPTLNRLLERYSGKVKLAYRDFPAQQLHPRAELAAEASRCAADQGRFWQYHDLLFASDKETNRDELTRYAAALRIEEHRFEDCLNGGKYIPQIKQDFEDGLRAGIAGTPTFFINGILLAGAQPEGALEQLIDEELAGRVGH